MEPISENPYAAPQTFDLPTDHLSNAESIRREHLKTEASPKGIGFLYYFTGIIVAKSSVSFISQYDGGIPGLAQATVGAVLVILAISYFITGTAVRKLKPWTRIGARVLSGIGLLGFPIGTLINA